MSGPLGADERQEQTHAARKCAESAKIAYDAYHEFLPPDMADKAFEIWYRALFSPIPDIGAVLRGGKKP